MLYWLVENSFSKYAKKINNGKLPTRTQCKYITCTHQEEAWEIGVWGLVTTK